ncbi:conserved Plasmodium protein, unknown function [Plasmodium knowlesi strain H]|uniref:Uncharacterized protein n=3 Tax=Plasmodium knowlesi TaxID=5850 RepID=A0A5K1UDA0_PLAKH|nr:uncharacterized protein PKNH_0315200 [Plasmodium knowlesi strain H]OTN68426.1 Uncharacterized protein PKNOH_S02307600 [Plasmodium knowlesi]CAA9986577.1 conserved protein, unknown function [Plasmodium knowlesi strain H]SBO24150.1 conserved Plasmodium protein, unknown function [Plasmodium knowlesi strain H]SBO29290.1 conserved Plasmodium protein, unknown function [Plasmodium knowlesi strain H]VVS76051.1 conserved protein, unknown function [Plasmodium knowlesi strain H]|eukprot:XP_002261118.1 [Plasmodium knowlesi strain H]
MPHGRANVRALRRRRRRRMELLVETSLIALAILLLRPSLFSYRSTALLLSTVLVLISNVTRRCACFIPPEWAPERGTVPAWRLFVSKPAQKKANQLKTKIVVNKKKKEENLKKKISKGVEFKSSSKYKLIEDLLDGYPYTSLPAPEKTVQRDPFILLKGKVKRQYLQGMELPFGLIDPVKYELLKLIGRLGDPFKNLCSHSLTPRLLIDSLFKNQPELTFDEFCYRLEYRRKFLMPSYTNVFMYEKELLWQEWIAVRNLKEVSPETGEDDHERIQKILQPDETTMPIVMIRVNREISNQGIHPAILKMFFDFLNVDKRPDKLSRDYAFLKLESIMRKLKNRDFLEGIKPDYIYFMFNERAKEVFSSYSESEFQKSYHEALNHNNMKQNLLSQNATYKKERKLFSEKTKNSLMKFYDIELPSFFKDYVKKKEENYKVIQAKINKMITSKYLKRKQRREDILAGRITPQELSVQVTPEDDTQPRRKKKKKRRK